MSVSGGHEESRSEKYGTHTPMVSHQYNNAFNSYAQSLGFDPTQWMPTTRTDAASTGSAVVDPYTGSPVSSAPIGGDYKGPAVQGGPQIGANALQRDAIHWQHNNLAKNPVREQLGDISGNDIYKTNELLSWVGKHYTDLYDTTLNNVRGQSAPQLSAPQLSAPQSSAHALSSGHMSAAGPTIDAPTGATMVAPYSALYSQALIDPSLMAYDYGTDRAFSALDARTAGAGAFGNTRGGLAYSDLGSQAALGRGQLASGLLASGLTSAINAGQADASRQFGANTQNAANVLNNNQFNANLLTNNSQFNAGLMTNNNQFNANLATSNNQYNAGLQQDTAKTNLAAKQTHTAQQLQAAQQAANILKEQAGLSQQLLDNVVTVNGINTQAAQQLFMNGAITQAQLASILNQAAAYNGYSYSENATGSTDRVSGGFTVPFG